MPMLFRISAEDIRDPMDSQTVNLRLEDAADCDGLVCGTLLHDADGQPCYPPRHSHLMVSGEQPRASARACAVLRLEVIRRTDTIPYRQWEDGEAADRKRILWMRAKQR